MILEIIGVSSDINTVYEPIKMTPVSLRHVFQGSGSEQLSR